MLVRRTRWVFDDEATVRANEFNDVASVAESNDAG